jgi:hypothetical protein
MLVEFYSINQSFASTKIYGGYVEFNARTENLKSCEKVLKETSLISPKKHDKKDIFQIAASYANGF